MLVYLADQSLINKGKTLHDCHFSVMQRQHPFPQMEANIGFVIYQMLCYNPNNAEVLDHKLVFIVILIQYQSSY